MTRAQLTLQISAKRQNQKGFTLLELLLSIALLALLLAGIYKIFDDWLTRSVNRTAAADMMRVQSAAEDFVFANFEAMRADPPGFIEIPVAALIAANHLPNGYQAVNAFRQSVRAFRRNLVTQRLNRDGTGAVNTMGQPIMITTIEVLTLSDNNGAIDIVENDRLLDAARAGGPKMGVVMNIVLGGTVTFTNNIASPMGEWSIPLADINALYTRTATAVGGYLAVHGLVSSESSEANDNYLYRVSVNQRPELNRMATDLNMGSNPITNVGTFVADDVVVNGNAAFLGITQGLTTDTAQALTIDQALRVEGAGADESRIYMRQASGTCGLGALPAAPGGTRTMAPVGACTVSGGELNVISAAATNKDATADIAGDLRADGSILTDITTVTDTTTSDGISTFRELRGTDLTASLNVVAPTSQVNGNLIQTRQLQTGELLLNAANSTIDDALVTANARPNQFQSQTMDVLNTATFTGNLEADALVAERALTINDATPAGYRDNNPDAARRRNAVCTRTAGRTYCEPANGSSIQWANGYTETCFIVAGKGYRCDFTKTATGEDVGSSYFCRAVISGRAAHRFQTSACP